MLSRILTQLPALIAALLAIRLATLGLDHGVAAPVVVVVALLAVVACLYAGGRATFRKQPYAGGLLMEAGLGVLVCIAAAVGAALIAWAIDEAPGKEADPREEQIWTATLAAVTTFAASVFIKPEGDRWNPVKSAVEAVFGESFKERRDVLEKDARNAVQEDRYGAEAQKHQDDVVDGWGWAARRLRTKHIADQVKR